MRIAAGGVGPAAPLLRSGRRCSRRSRRTWARRALTIWIGWRSSTDNVLVGGRHLALPIEEYDETDDLGQGQRCLDPGGAGGWRTGVLQALDRAGLTVEDVDCLISVTVTGVATPSIDARLMNRLGCLAGSNGCPSSVSAALPAPRGSPARPTMCGPIPDQVAVLLSVELCSLTLQREDLSIPNLIASGLFGDGAAAAVVVGGEPLGAGAERLSPAGRSSMPTPKSDGLGHQRIRFPDRALGRGPGGGPPPSPWGCRRFPRRSGSGPGRHRNLGIPSRRAQGPPGHAGGARAARRGARARLATPCARSAIYPRPRSCSCWRRPFREKRSPNQETSVDAGHGAGFLFRTRLASVVIR